MVTTLALLVTALLTGLVTTLLGLVAALLLVVHHRAAVGVGVLFSSDLGLLVALLITGLISALALLITGLVAALALLISALALLIASLTMITALARLVSFVLLISSFGCSRFFSLVRSVGMGAIFDLLVATIFQILIKTGIVLTDSGSLRLFQILVHRC